MTATPAPAVTLAEALEPLYRGYLRRLDEMVCRLPAGAALTERTSRDAAGRPALAASGLPVRFDVADARDGHTWEVHGARADEPRASDVRVGNLVVQLSAGNWEELPVVCGFEAEPSAAQLDTLADLFHGFVRLAWHGAFAGERTADDRWLRRAHGIEVQLRGRELWAILDLGTCPPGALEALCAALGGYAEEDAALAYVRIGGKP